MAGQSTVVKSEPNVNFETLSKESKEFESLILLSGIKSTNLCGVDFTVIKTDSGDNVILVDNATDEVVKISMGK